ncbi:MAG: O-antigen ligase family protein [Endozoicomonadaceae bacterium]|nr:O-antigen ligase family protein [Endozoicomonadaceae bacterium]
MNSLLSFSSCHGTVKEYLSRLEQLIIAYILPVGLVIQITGVIWLGRGSGWATQTYLWLILPSFVVFLINIKKITTWRPTWAEIFLLMFLVWAFLSKGWGNTTLTWADVAKRCIFISLYIYAIIRLGETPEKLQKCLLFCCFVAACAALLSLIYHYGVEGHGMLYRQYRIYNMGIKKFADFRIPPWAAIYYAILFSLLFAWQNTVDSTGKYKKQLTLAGLFTLGFYLLMTWSRGALAGAAAGTLFSSFILSNNNKKRSAIFLLTIFLLSVSVIFLDFLYRNNLTHAVMGSEKIFDLTFDGRTNIWKETLELIIQRPWMGHGFHEKIWVFNNWSQSMLYP